MRSILCLCATVLLVVAWSVPTPAMEAHVGIKGGMNIANVDFEQSGQPADSRSGIAAGGYLAFPVSSAVSIQPEALFMMKGDQEDMSSVTVGLELDYIEFPVLAKVNLGSGDKVRPSLFAGPAVGFNVGAHSMGISGVDALGNPILQDGAEVDIKSATKSVEFDLVFGGGLEFPVGKSQSLGVEVRYGFGLTRVDDIEDDDPGKNRVLSIMGSVGFI